MFTACNRTSTTQFNQAVAKFTDLADKLKYKSKKNPALEQTSKDCSAKLEALAGVKERVVDFTLEAEDFLENATSMNFKDKAEEFKEMANPLELRLPMIQYLRSSSKISWIS